MYKSKSMSEDSGASVDYYLWTTGVSSKERTLPPPHRKVSEMTKWEPLQQARFNDYKIAGETIERSLRAQDDWHFSDVGQGAFSFEARQAGGNLVIALSTWHHDDTLGYYIVLDDDNHDTYVLRVKTLGNNGLLRGRVEGENMTRQRTYERVQNRMYVDKNFRLQFDRPQQLWVMYQQGAIVVGSGATPGSGPIILYMRPIESDQKRRQNGGDIYYFGFARHGSRWKTPVHIQNVTAFRFREAGPNSISGGGTSDLFPLPPYPVI